MLARLWQAVLVVWLLCLQSCAVRPVPDVPTDVTSLIESTVQVEHAAAILGDDQLVHLGGGTGTGVIVMVGADRTYIVTAHHVCGMPAGVLRVIQHEVRVNRYNGFSHHATVVKEDAVGDVCLLAVDSVFGRPVPISEDTPPVGARIVFIGGPIGHFGKGYAIVQDGRYGGSIDEGVVHRVLLAASTAPGMSGGGVFWRGQLIGIVTAVAKPFGTPVYAADVPTLRSLLSTQTP